LLLLAGLTALLLPITRLGQGLQQVGAMDAAGLALAVLLLVLFLRRQRHVPEPIVPLGLLRLPVVMAGCGMVFVCFFVMIALTLLVPLRLQVVAGLAPGAAALQLLPLTLGIPIAAFAAGRFIHRTGRVSPLQRIGVALVPVGLLAAALGPPTAGLASALVLLMLGFGFGLQMPSALLIVQHAVPHTLIGTATALTTFFRLLGGAVGVAVLGTVVLALLRADLPAGAASSGLEAWAVPGGPAAAVPDRAFRLALGAAAVFSLLALAGTRRLPAGRLHEQRPAAPE
jgi:hypothetical protein